MSTVPDADQEHFWLSIKIENTAANAIGAKSKKTRNKLVLFFISLISILIMPRKKVICFDFDDVITDGNLLSSASHKFASGFKKIRIMMDFLRYNENPKKFYWFIRKVVKRGKGIRFDDLEEAALKQRLITGVPQTLRALKKRGYKVVIVSTNDERIIKKYLEKHGLLKYIDHIYAAQLEVKNGVLTGKMSGNVIETEKTGVVRKIKKIYNVSEKDIIYVGDGLTDIPIFRLVGKGIIFCPKTVTKLEIYNDQILKKKERENEIFVVVENDLRAIMKFIS